MLLLQLHIMYISVDDLFYRAFMQSPDDVQRLQCNTENKQRLHDWSAGTASYNSCCSSSYISTGIVAACWLCGIVAHIDKLFI